LQSNKISIGGHDLTLNAGNSSSCSFESPSASFTLTLEPGRINVDILLGGKDHSNTGCNCLLKRWYCLSMDKPHSFACPPISSFRLFVVVDGCCTLRQATVVDLLAVMTGSKAVYFLPPQPCTAPRKADRSSGRCGQNIGDFTVQAPYFSLYCTMHRRI
jgi:hypothetical protein